MVIFIFNIESALDSYGEVLARNPASLIICIYSFAVIIIIKIQFSFFIVGLWGFHTYLCLNNLTTNEFIKEHWNIESKNPFHEYINLFKFQKKPLSKLYTSNGIFTYINNVNAKKSCIDCRQINTKSITITLTYSLITIVIKYTC